ncbi:MAG: NAD-dependent epimerase/dehydratase family protein [Thermomicrobiales bacterium]
MKVVVTGASGKAGRAVTAHLVESGYEVLAIDIVAPSSDLGTPFMHVDLTEYGQTIEALAGADAVVHLANIPAPGIYTPAHTFTTNTAMNSNIFLAAAQLKLGRVVWASSETTLGLPFDVPPRYAPVDEDHFPVPTSTYALSKVVAETMAEQISGWSGIPFVGLRFSNILTLDDYALFPTYWNDPMARKWNLWGYVDVRDAAAACRNALEADVTGSHNLIIAAADTVMTRPSADLMAEVFPAVKLTREVGEFETLLAIDGARRTIGYAPQHSWRDHVPQKGNS